MAHGSHGKRLGDGSLMAEDFEEGLGHELPLSTLRNVLLILFLLTFVTVAISRVDFGKWNMVIAIVIASVKATIVATFFMHLKFEGRTILMYVFYPLILLLLLIGSSLGDISTRELVRPSTVPEVLPVVKVVGGHDTGHSSEANVAGAHGQTEQHSGAAGNSEHAEKATEARSAH